MKISWTVVGSTLTELIALPALATAAMYEGECVDLAQRIHSVSYDIDLSSRKIQQLGSQLASYAESESSDEAEMAEHSRTLSLAHKAVNDSRLEAVKVASELSVGQDRAEEYLSQVNRTSLDLKKHQDMSLELRQRKLKLGKEVEEADSRIRRDELKAQMLSNDIDSTNRTLIDSINALNNRRADLAKITAQVSKTEAKIRHKQDEVDRQSKVYQEASSALERSRRQLMSDQQLLSVETHKKEIQERAVSGLKMRLDSENVDISAKRHSLKVLNDTVVNQTIARLAALRDEEGRLQRSSDLEKERIARFRTVVNHSVSESASPRSEDFLIPSLRRSLHQSRAFLSQNGYMDHLSLLQAEPNNELDALKAESELLSLQNQMREARDDEFNAEVSLNSTLQAEDAQRRTILDIQSRAAKDEREVAIATATLSNISDQVRIMNEGIENLTLLIRSESAQETSITRAFNAVKTELEVIKAEYKSILASQEAGKKSVAQQEKDLQQKRSQLDRQLNEKSATEKVQQISESDRRRVDGDLQRTKNMSEKVDSEMKEISVLLDKDTTKRTESLAEVAQISRRLEEKTHEYEDALSQEGKELIIVDDLKKSIEKSLLSRRSLEDQLTTETSTRERLELVLRNVRDRMADLKCTV